QIYDEAPEPAAIPEWDALAWSFDLDGDPDKTALDEHSFRLVAQAGRHGTDRTALLRGDGGAWTDVDLPLGDDVAATPDRVCVRKGYRGEGRDDSRGWHIDAYVPWTAVGLEGPPEGSSAFWNAALTAFDRDDLAGTLRGAPQHWPGAGYDETDPSTWATWEFLGAPFLGRVESGAVPGAGRPAYAVAHAVPPHVPGTETTVAIREGVEGAVVESAAVGASERLCSGDDDYNFGDGPGSFGGTTGREYFHVQNQEDYADWPCFARIYLKFPLARLPAGKVVLSAVLRLHHSMPTGSGDQGAWSLVQAFAVPAFLRDGVTPWTSANVTWNDGPPAVENCAGFWGDRTGMMETGWDDLPAWHWDVGRAVARAVADGSTHAAFALYSADSEYHTGKQFVRSGDFSDWGDPTQRPTLEVVVADPAP
ncbi:MAG: DNRLRE domain-containing protein, partial [Deltaproteobacteria bacterium]|nr:DNRLRE domain-containing protein [Deltaproteobacteria bacterium]